MTYKDKVDQAIRLGLVPEDLISHNTAQKIADAAWIYLPLVRTRIHILLKDPEKNVLESTIPDLNRFKTFHICGVWTGEHLTDCEIWYFDSRVLTAWYLLNSLYRFQDKKLNHISGEEYFLRSCIVPERLQKPEFDACRGCVRKWISSTLLPEKRCQPENQMEVLMSRQPCHRYCFDINEEE